MKYKKVFLFFPPDRVNTHLVSNVNLIDLASDNNFVGNVILQYHYQKTVLWQLFLEMGGKADGWIYFSSTHEIVIAKKQTQSDIITDNYFTDDESSPSVTNRDRFEQPKDDNEVFYPQPIIASIAGIDSKKTSKIEKFLLDNGIPYYHGKNGKVWTTSTAMDDFLKKKAAGNDPTNFVN